MAGSTSLIFLQDLAAVGPDLRGRKVAISLSPTWFFNRRDVLDRDAYAGNFSRQHASELREGRPSHEVVGDAGVSQPLRLVVVVDRPCDDDAPAVFHQPRRDLRLVSQALSSRDRP